MKLFSIPIHLDKPKESINNEHDEIEQAIEKIEREKLYEYLSYVNEKHESNDDLTYKISQNVIEDFDMKNILERIRCALNNYHKECHWRIFEEDDLEYSLENSWLNIMKPNTRNHEYHTHARYDISGVYYHYVTNETGGIIFKNPIPMIENMNFPFGQNCPQNIEILPSNGEIFLFPSWLMHRTHVNYDTKDRISLAFNIKAKEKT